jgi:glycosyltransferase involved in cell wall biosynthesis
LINPITFKPEAQPSPYPAFTGDAVTWIMLAELDTGRKAQDILIQALSSAKWKERSWQLHLYGKGKDNLMLQNLVNECGLENKIILEGFTNDIKRVLQNCHLLFQCTRIDAMPISVVEAMAMARPCFVSEVGDMPSWVAHNYNGFICPLVNAAAIDIALENCWQQKENWQQLGKNAFSTFNQKYPLPYEEKAAEILQQFI